MRRLRRELDELNQACERAASEEEEASFELTRSARAFSRRAREVTDDKLAFSATLMRAGEVSAANRMIEDLELDVRTEEAALTEQVNEVKVAAATRRATMTRLRLARTLAAAMLSAGLLSLSAAGMAVASFVADLNDSGAGTARPSSSGVASGTVDSGFAAHEVRSIRLPDGTRLKLSRDQFRALKALTADPDLNRRELERLLIELVGPAAAGELVEALTGVSLGASQASGAIGGHLGAPSQELDSKAGAVESKTKDIDSEPKSDGAKPASDSSKPDKKPADPDDKPDDDDLVDTPLGGTKPDSVLSGKNG
ncbi:MAG: hypothetical protein ACRDK3_16360 [Actinomycetota bacterium]